MKIKQFYLNKAKYKAVDESGKVINLTIDYWNGEFHLDEQNRDLENFAQKLLNKKHRINFVHKMLE